MYKRSLGSSIEDTSAFVSGTVEIMAQYQVGSVLKHFPSYGNNADTYTGIAVGGRSIEELAAQDLIPFASGIESGCDAILVSHTIINCLDPELPTNLSPGVHDYIRLEMGFEGVIITDDLIMAAITRKYGDEEADVLAVLAGNDLLCSSNYQVQYAAILDAVAQGRISMEQLDMAVLRILRWKIKLELL